MHGRLPELLLDNLRIPALLIQFLPSTECRAHWAAHQDQRFLLLDEVPRLLLLAHIVKIPSFAPSIRRREVQCETRQEAESRKHLSCMSNPRWAVNFRDDCFHLPPLLGNSPSREPLGHSGSFRWAADLRGNFLQLCPTFSSIGVAVASQGLHQRKDLLVGVSDVLACLVRDELEQLLEPCSNLRRVHLVILPWGRWRVLLIRCRTRIPRLCNSWIGVTVIVLHEVVKWIRTSRHPASGVIVVGRSHRCLFSSWDWAPLFVCW